MRTRGKTRDKLLLCSMKLFVSYMLVIVPVTQTYRYIQYIHTDKERHRHRDMRRVIPKVRALSNLCTLFIQATEAVLW